MVRDPVCGMNIDPSSAVAERQHRGQTYYFCSDDCARKFDADPAAYIQQSANGNHRQGRQTAASLTTGVADELVGPVRVELPLVGLDCATCVQTVERALGDVDGVQEVHVNFPLSTAHVVYEQERATLPQLIDTVKQAGYDVGVAEMRVQIEALHCASCVQTIETKLLQVPGK